MKPSNITTRSDVAMFLFTDKGRTLNSDALEFYNDAANDRLIAYTRRKFCLDKETRYFKNDLSSNQIFFANNWPFLFLHTLCVDELREFGSSSAISTGTIAYSSNGRIELVYDVFSRKPRSNKLVFTRGYHPNYFQPHNTGLDFSLGATAYNVTFSAYPTRFNSSGSFVSHVQNKLNSAVSGISFSYDSIDRAFEISANQSTFTIDSGSSAAWDLGILQNKSGSGPHYSDFDIIEIPPDLKMATIHQAAFWYKQSYGQGDGMFGISSKSMANQTVTKPVSIADILPEVKAIWNMYKKVNV